jgi:hypothetical protein
MRTFETATVFQLPGLSERRDPATMRAPGSWRRFEYRATVSLVALFREST